MVAPPNETTADPYAVIAALRQQLAERSVEREAALTEKAKAEALAGRTADVERNSEYGGRIEQQSALRRMQKLRDQGLALRAIAEQMKAAGVSISHAGVKNALAAAEGRP